MLSPQPGVHACHAARRSPVTMEVSAGSPGVRGHGVLVLGRLDLADGRTGCWLRVPGSISWHRWSRFQKTGSWKFRLGNHPIWPVSLMPWWYCHQGGIRIQVHRLDRGKPRSRYPSPLCVWNIVSEHAAHVRIKFVSKRPATNLLKLGRVEFDLSCFETDRSSITHACLCQQP